MATTRDNIPTTFKGLSQELERRINSGTFDERQVVEHLHSFFRNYESTQEYRPLRIPAQVRVCEGVKLTEDFMAQTMIFNGQLLKRHENGGGFVPVNQSTTDSSKPFVEDTVYVGPFAMVFDNARLRGEVHISGYARVFGNAKISGKVRISGHAWILDNARITGTDIFISDNVRIFDSPWITGKVRITGDAWISGNANVIGNSEFGYVWICDGTWVYGKSQVSGTAYIRGNAKLRGDYRIKAGELSTGTYEKAA